MRADGQSPSPTILGPNFLFRKQNDGNVSVYPSSPASPPAKTAATKRAWNRRQRGHRRRRPRHIHHHLDVELNRLYRTITKHLHRRHFHSHWQQSHTVRGVSANFSITTTMLPTFWQAEWRHARKFSSTYGEVASYKEPLLMFANGKGNLRQSFRFLAQISCGPSPGVARDSAITDNDGDIDIVTNNAGDYPSLLRNGGPPVMFNHWSKFAHRSQINPMASRLAQTECEGVTNVEPNKAA